MQGFTKDLDSSFQQLERGLVKVVGGVVKQFQKEHCEFMDVEHKVQAKLRAEHELREESCSRGAAGFSEDL